MPPGEIGLQRVSEAREAFPMDRQIAVCVGISWWKQRRVGDFLAAAGGKPVFRRGVAGAVSAALARNGAIGVWATREPPGLAEAAALHGIALIRLEDGFIRSVGLGSDFLPPASLVFDTVGIYCDPRRENDLERLLRETDFDAALLARARRLIDRLIAGGVTKYNLGARGPGGLQPRIAWPRGRRRILVPGQVEDDLSVRAGGGDIGDNLGLLARVRAANPDAFILYKPHPDVVAGHRKGGISPHKTLRYADAIVRRGSIAALLPQIDELHTLTSLSGFEALLRRVPVTVYGRPFYAGWGLTNDLVMEPRGRILAVEELAAAALILYPRYLDPATRRLCEPETVVERLARPELWRAGPLVWARRLQGALIEALRPDAPHVTRWYFARR
jgi:capsular polysaccharide export protein